MNPGYRRSRSCLVRRGSVGAERCGSRCERTGPCSTGPCQLQQEAVVPFALNSWPVTLLHAAQQRLAFAKLFLPTALYGGLDCDVVGSVGKRVKGQALEEIDVAHWLGRVELAHRASELEAWLTKWLAMSGMAGRGCNGGPRAGYNYSGRNPQLLRRPGQLLISLASLRAQARAAQVSASPSQLWPLMLSELLLTPRQATRLDAAICSIRSQAILDDCRGPYVVERGNCPECGSPKPSSASNTNDEVSRVGPRRYSAAAMRCLLAQAQCSTCCVEL